MPIVERPDLDESDIQGDVLPGFRRQGDPTFAQQFLFFRIEDEASARRGLTSVLLPRISSAKTVRRSGAEDAPASPAVNIGFSWAGLDAIGLDERERRDFDQHEAFREGLWQRSKRLQDLLGPPGDWTIGDHEHDVHVVINIGGAQAEAVESTAANLEAKLGAQGLRVQHGAVSGAYRPGGLEPFGFADGLARPLVDGYHGPPTGGRQALNEEAPTYLWEFDVEKRLRHLDIERSNFSATMRATEQRKAEQRFKRQRRSAAARFGGELPVTRFSEDGRPFLSPKQFIVNPAARATEPTRFIANGSFMVWIRFVQDRGRFKEQCKTMADRLTAAWGRRVTQAEAAALLVGRRKDGTSMVFQPLFKRSSSEGTRETFRYVPDDATGHWCPLGAHARKMNPRTIESLRHTIIRRGIPFTNGGEEGLLFVCYQSSIEDQYETLQRHWANWPYKPERNASPDPLISQVLRSRPGRIEIRNFNQRGSTPISVKNDWIVPTGGLYLFVPSLRSLRMLTER